MLEIGYMSIVVQTWDDEHILSQITGRKSRARDSLSVKDTIRLREFFSKFSFAQPIRKRAF